MYIITTASNREAPSTQTAWSYKNFIFIYFGEKRPCLLIEAFVILTRNEHLGPFAVLWCISCTWPHWSPVLLLTGRQREITGRCGWRESGPACSPCHIVPWPPALPAWKHCIYSWRLSLILISPWPSLPHYLSCSVSAPSSNENKACSSLTANVPGSTLI